MPEKTTRERARRAKKMGKPLTVKSDDLGLAYGQSTHAAKKSRGVKGFVDFIDRRATRTAAPTMGEWSEGKSSSRGPGDGKVRRDVKHDLDEETFASRGPKRLVRMPEVPSKKHGASTVNGRKKAPSEMHVLRAGG